MSSASFTQSLNRLDPNEAKFATSAVDLILSAARGARASDVHLQPTPAGLELAWRIDGVLQPLGVIPARVSANVVSRLKVVADLLTYRNDLPQEGRIRAAPGEPETRVSTFPTLHGERAVIRLFAAPGRFLRLDELGFPAEVTADLLMFLRETAGMILIAGPAGSGKTTTLYACLRELASKDPGRCLTTLEDPIESAVPGVVQAQVNHASGLTLEVGLRSMLRQDPEVIAVGEIRDAATAEVAFQAALTGHLVLTTFHAGSAVEVVSRLTDMGIEPYLLRSGLLAVLGQRLVRTLCRDCKQLTDDHLGISVNQAWAPVGCPACSNSGYVGRSPLVEWLVTAQGEIGRAILERADKAQLEAQARHDGMLGYWDRAGLAISEGTTSPAEVRRALGLNDPWRARRGK
jgi:general secretion pathway protein E